MHPSRRHFLTSGGAAALLRPVRLLQWWPWWNTSPPSPPVPFGWSQTVAYAVSADGSLAFGDDESGPPLAAKWDTSTSVRTDMQQNAALGCDAAGDIAVGYSEHGIGIDHDPSWFDTSTGVLTLLDRPSGGGPNGVATCCSSDGSIIFGYVPAPVVDTPAWWDRVGGGLPTLLDLPGGTTVVGSFLYGCTSDGSIAVGDVSTTGGSLATGGHACSWVKATGAITILPRFTTFTGAQTVNAYGCSDDGTIIVGNDTDNTGAYVLPVVWVNGVERQLDFPTGHIAGIAYGCDATGTTAVGYTAQTDAVAVKWDIATGAVTILPSPPRGGASPVLAQPSIAWAISKDATMAVGQARFTGEDFACWWVL